MNFMAIRAETCSCIGTAVLAMLLAVMPTIIRLSSALTVISSHL